MNCNEARQISIIDYLAKYGFNPQYIKGADHWYISPLRKEKRASLKVNNKLNAWYDHGTGEGGNMIDLGIRLHQCSVNELLSKLGKEDYSLSFHQPIQQAAYESEKKIIIQSVVELQNPGLIDYLHGRAIDFCVAKTYCKEVTFGVNDRKHCAIGFQNRSGGYELRNAYLKLSSAPKDFSLIEQGADVIHVVEGFMDLLSLLTIRERKMATNFMVLNSLSLVARSLETLQQYRNVFLYLDHDNAGIKAIDTITKSVTNAVDVSHFYEGFKDLNDYLINSNKYPKARG